MHFVIDGIILVRPQSDASSKSALNTNAAEVADEDLVKLGLGDISNAFGANVALILS